MVRKGGNNIILHVEKAHELFLPGYKVELHHLDGNHNNWRTKNLVALTNDKT